MGYFLHVEHEVSGSSPDTVLRHNTKSADVVLRRKIGYLVTVCFGDQGIHCEHRIGVVVIQRDVAQMVRAPGLGPGGRRFETCHPDLSNSSSIV